jgi:hypothetical protein
MRVLRIKSEECNQWLLQKHYAKRLPSISFAYGLYEENVLTGIVTYGMPASPFLCIGVCGKQNKEYVIELNRLCVDSTTKNATSFLVSNSLQMLPKPSIVVSYADTAQNHVGYIYQACNFFFTGTTKERTDMAGNDGAHSRHNKGDINNRINRSAKHRYVFFVGSKTQKQKLKKELLYQILEYPKGKTERYDASAKVEIQQLLF